MYKKTITYTDYNGNERTEDFYFNFNKAELAKMEMSTNGGFAESVKRIIETEDRASLITIFEDFIVKSYGKKSPDGKRFIKDDETTKEFTQTEAYSQLFIELASNADEAVKFINGIIPSDMRQDSLSKQ